MTTKKTIISRDAKEVIKRLRSEFQNRISMFRKPTYTAYLDLYYSMCKDIQPSVEDLKKETVQCPSCKGRGWNKEFGTCGYDHERVTCRFCEGSGKVLTTRLIKQISKAIAETRILRAAAEERFKKQYAVILALDKKGAIAQLRATGLDIF